MAEQNDLVDGVTAPWAASILDFWFKEVGEERWWAKSDATDAAIIDRYAALWAEKRDSPADEFLGRADEALAAIILFDQFPRNMFRHRADAFATDSLARDIARSAIARGFDVQIGGAGRAFFYMPFQHSENMDDQRLSLELFEALGDANSLNFARQHAELIGRFGRFPHRNAALGRITLPEEQAAIAQGSHW